MRFLFNCLVLGDLQPLCALIPEKSGAVRARRAEQVRGALCRRTSGLVFTDH